MPFAYNAEVAMPSSFPFGYDEEVSIPISLQRNGEGGHHHSSFNDDTSIYKYREIQKSSESTKEL